MNQNEVEMSVDLLKTVLKTLGRLEDAVRTLLQTFELEIERREIEREKY